MYFICCYSITNTVNSLGAHSNLKVHRTNSPAISYHARFSRGTVCKNNIFFLLFLFGFFCFSFVFLSLFCFLFVCVCFFKTKNKYCDTHWTMWADKRQKNFSRPISGNKTTFIGLRSKVNSWVQLLEVPSQIAELQP